MIQLQTTPSNYDSMTSQIVREEVTYRSLSPSDPAELIDELLPRTSILFGGDGQKHTVGTTTG